MGSGTQLCCFGKLFALLSRLRFCWTFSYSLLTNIEGVYHKFGKHEQTITMALADNCYSPVAVDSLYCRIYCSVKYELGFTSVHQRHLPPTLHYNTYISYYGPRKSPLRLMYTFHQSELVTITLGVQVLSSQPAATEPSSTPVILIPYPGLQNKEQELISILSPTLCLLRSSPSLTTTMRI